MAESRLPLREAPVLLALGPEHLFVSDLEGTLTGYRLHENRSGGASRRWRRRLGAPLATPPLILGDRMVTLSLDNWLRVLGQSDGALLGKARVSRRVLRPVVPISGDSFVVSPEGSPELLEVHPQARREGRRWWSGEEHQKVRGGPVRAEGTPWFLATLGPWNWQLAGFRLDQQPVPDEPPGDEAPLAGGQEPRNGGETPAPPAEDTQP